MSKSPDNPKEPRAIPKATLVMADLSDEEPIMIPKTPKGTIRGKRAASAAPGTATPSIAKRSKNSVTSSSSKTPGSETRTNSTLSRRTRSADVIRHSLPLPDRASPKKSSKAPKEPTKVDGVMSAGKPDAAKELEATTQSKDADEADPIQAASTIMGPESSEMADNANDCNKVNNAKAHENPSTGMVDGASPLKDGGIQRKITLSMPDPANAASGLHQLSDDILAGLGQYKAICEDSSAKIDAEKAVKEEEKWAGTLHKLNDQLRVQARQTSEAKEVELASNQDVETTARYLTMVQEALRNLEALAQTPYEIPWSLDIGKSKSKKAEQAHAVATMKAHDVTERLEQLAQRERETTDAISEAKVNHLAAKMALDEGLKTREMMGSACEYVENISAIISLGIDGTKELGDSFPGLFETAKRMAKERDR
ncbi:hypothetical protein Neosp_015148 [[Neocosmospora] mangrovei]